MWNCTHLGILLMNSCNTDIFFSNYYHLQSVRFEMFIVMIEAKLSSKIKLRDYNLYNYFPEKRKK